MADEVVREALLVDDRHFDVLEDVGLHLRELVVDVLGDKHAAFLDALQDAGLHTQDVLRGELVRASQLGEGDFVRGHFALETDDGLAESGHELAVDLLLRGQRGGCSTRSGGEAAPAPLAH